jgi:prevent-host-death family protein
LRNPGVVAKIDPMALSLSAMKSMSAKDAKNAFGLLLDTARAEPVTIEKHGRRVVVVLSVEEYARLIEGRFKAPGAKSAAARKKNEGG